MKWISPSEFLLIGQEFRIELIALKFEFGERYNPEEYILEHRNEHQNEHQKPVKFNCILIEMPPPCPPLCPTLCPPPIMSDWHPKCYI